MSTHITTHSHHQYNKILVFAIGGLSAMTGLLFGLDTGVIAGARHFISLSFSLTTHQEEWVVSSILLGALIGALLANPVSRQFGRQRVLLAASIIFILGSLLSAASTSYLELVLVRVGLGVALGFASFTAPLYLSEISPKRVRGAMVTLYQLMLTIGLLGAFLLGVHFSHNGDWQFMLGAPAIPAMIMLIGVIALPQSPQWLMLVGKRQQAYAVLKRILRDSKAVEQELNDINFNLSRTQEGIKEFRFAYFRRVLLLGITLQCIQIMTGMNTMMYYAPKIFSLAGYTSPVQQMWGTVIIGLLNVGTTILSLFLIDRLGRRPLMFIGLICMTAGMFILGTTFFINAEPSSALAQHSILAGMLIFVFGFAVSLGPIIWLMCSEIFPLRGRDIGVMFTTATNWAFSFLLGLMFLTVLQQIGAAYTFWLLAGICVISTVIIYLFAPETKGVTLETIEKNLVDGKRLRYIGR